MTANSSGNRKTLFLTAGEIRTALGYKTIIGIRQFLSAFKGGTGIMENRNNRGGMRGPGMGRRPAEKSKDFKGTWMKIIRYCKRYLAVIVVALICAVAGTILTILGPDKLSDLTKVITEGIATGIDMERVKSIGLTLVVFYVGSAILSFGQQFIMATVTQNVTKQLRSDISGKINRLPIAYYNKTSTGDVLSRVTNDVDMKIGRAHV